jgi:hypothetical protein
MKHAKMLGLAAVAALALMALVGAGTASATIVCSASGTGTACAGSHGNQYTGPISAELTTGKSAQLVSGFITVTCTESTAGGSVTGSTGAGSLTSLTFNSCTSGLGACTAKSTGTPWAAQATTGTAPNGTMKVNNVAGEFTCAGETCKYSAASATTEVKGGAPAEIVATKVPLSKAAGSGPFCSSTATWSGEYKITSPTSLYLT